MKSKQIENNFSVFLLLLITYIPPRTKKRYLMYKKDDGIDSRKNNELKEDIRIKNQNNRKKIIAVFFFLYNFSLNKKNKNIMPIKEIDKSAKKGPVNIEKGSKIKIIFCNSFKN